MPRWMRYDKMLPLLLDNVYGLRPMREIAELTNYSTPRIGQFVQELVRNATAPMGYRDNPWYISAYVYRSDKRNRAEANTPEAFYHRERGLTEREWG